MQKYQYFITLFFACLVPATAAAQASKDELMRAVFAAQYRPGSQDALTKLPMLRDRARIRWYLVKPLASTVLNTGDTVLVAQAKYDTEKNKEDDNEVIEDDTVLNVYLMRQTGAAWSVLKRHENFMSRSEKSGRGSILFPMLSKDRQGLGIVDYAIDSGCHTRTLFLFDLGRFPLRDLTDGINTESSDNRNCSDSDSTPDTLSTSKWHLAPPKKPSSAYNDLVIVSVTETTVKGVTRTGKKLTRRYAYDGQYFRPTGAAN
jgi:hypothetical protein